VIAGLEVILFHAAQEYGHVSYRVFFVVAPDGLCYMLGELQ
jgi:hypothetical protein